MLVNSFATLSSPMVYSVSVAHPAVLQYSSVRETRSSQALHNNAVELDAVTSHGLIITAPINVPYAMILYFISIPLIKRPFGFGIIREIKKQESGIKR